MKGGVTMKDKLYKHHHKSFYFISKKVGLFSLVFLSLGTLIALPTYINIKTSNSEQGNAQVVDTTDDNKTDDKDGN